MYDKLVILFSIPPWFQQVFLWSQNYSPHCFLFMRSHKFRFFKHENLTLETNNF